MAAEGPRDQAGHTTAEAEQSKLTRLFLKSQVSLPGPETWCGRHPASEGVGGPTVLPETPCLPRDLGGWTLVRYSVLISSLSLQVGLREGGEEAHTPGQGVDSVLLQGRLCGAVTLGREKTTLGHRIHKAGSTEKSVLTGHSWSKTPECVKRPHCTK